MPANGASGPEPSPSALTPEPGARLPGGAPPEAEPSEPVGLELAAGWNLLALPPGASWPTSAWPGENTDTPTAWQVHAFSTGQSLPRGQEGDGQDSPGVKNADGLFLWVYNPKRRAFSVQGQPNPKNLDVVPPGTTLLSFLCQQEDADLGAHKAVAWDPIRQAYQEVPPPKPHAQALAPCDRTRHLAMTPLERPESDRPEVHAPTNVSATTHGATVTLAWQEPARGANRGARLDNPKFHYRVYRNGVPIRELFGVTEYEEELPKADLVYRYSVTAVVVDETGVALESSSTDPIPVRMTAPSSPPHPGAFEPARAVATPDGQAILPDVALSETEGTVLAHLVYGVAHDRSLGGAGSLRYHRSQAAAKPGSFDVSHILATGHSEWAMSEVAIAAQGKAVSVAWIEVETMTPSDAPGSLHPTASKPSSQVWVAQSDDGGLTFSAPLLLRESSVWKRGLDVAYDRSLGHHLVWGEGGQVYYLKNLKGEASNVFDVKKRSPVTEVVPYQIQAEPDENGNCRCPDCWCEESYTMGNAEQGPTYRYRIEESHVVQPALHVDDDAITIVGRQIRMWDNQPVLNSAWTAMRASPVYNPTPVQGRLLTRYLVGWQSVWKTAYEQGDEALYASLGFRQQMLYQGTWHEEDNIKVAQRPLVPGAWANARHAGEASTPRKATEWKQGSWQDHTFQNWRITSVASVGARGGDNTPSYPQIASTPHGLILVYENGTSDDPNIPGANPVTLQTSDDGGLSWSSANTIAQGYVPKIGVTESGEMAVLYYVPEGPTGVIAGRRSMDGVTQSVGPEEVLSTHPVRPVHFKSHGDQSDALQGRIALTSYNELLFAAWVEQGPEPSGDQVVTSRASPLTEVAGYDLTLPEYLTEGTGTQVHVSALNRYHMRVDSKDAIHLTRPRTALTTSPANAHEAPKIPPDAPLPDDADRPQNRSQYRWSGRELTHL